jgi:hypothetical protein
VAEIAQRLPRGTEDVALELAGRSRLRRWARRLCGGHARRGLCRAARGEVPRGLRAPDSGVPSVDGAFSISQRVRGVIAASSAAGVSLKPVSIEQASTTA